MSKNTLPLVELTNKQVQFCIGIKSLLDSDCSKESISAAMEELCDRMESIHFKAESLETSR